MWWEACREQMRPILKLVVDAEYVIFELHRSHLIRRVVPPISLEKMEATPSSFRAIARTWLRPIPEPVVVGMLPGKG
jgi:hypothetical protein